MTNERIVLWLQKHASCFLNNSFTMYCWVKESIFSDGTRKRFCVGWKSEIVLMFVGTEFYLHHCSGLKMNSALHFLCIPLKQWLLQLHKTCGSRDTEGIHWEKEQQPLISSGIRINCFCCFSIRLLKNYANKATEQNGHDSCIVIICMPQLTILQAGFGTCSISLVFTMKQFDHHHYYDNYDYYYKYT